MYVTEILVLVVGVVLLIVGKLKKKNTMFGIGIGILIASIVLGVPDFIRGFNDALGENL